MSLNVCMHVYSLCNRPPLCLSESLLYFSALHCSWLSLLQRNVCGPHILEGACWVSNQFNHWHFGALIRPTPARRRRADSTAAGKHRENSSVRWKRAVLWHKGLQRKGGCEGCWVQFWLDSSRWLCFNRTCSCSVLFLKQTYETT